MTKLTPQQLAKVQGHLLRNGSGDALLSELVDHLACEIEHYVWIGLPFESALDKVLMDANAIAVRHLSETYRCELTLSDEQLQQASLDDIVFEFRNKAYGAYDLRQAYRRNLGNALMMGLGMVLLLMSLMNGIGTKNWSYLSTTGLMWITGLLGVTLALGRWFHQHVQDKYRTAE
ncbi:hypothetical protein [Larkinella soli]|uniref:hypothetical protein n=1 Tax=Larkinella soli TaxID=1770527 RepID=UPI000FFCA384|nr:hypothetical protein [Larkinella soli]